MANTRAPAFANTIVSDHVARELVIIVPLPEDTGLRGDGRPKVRRFRRYQVELGERLATFRERYGVTQAEVARAVGARDHSAVSQWEGGVNVPEGMLRERLAELLDGRLWPDLRTAMIPGDGLPEPWDRAVRWYRRASRERRPREAAGIVIATVLDELRGVEARDRLRMHYCKRDGEWVRGVAERCGLVDDGRADLRRFEDAAYGLRWRTGCYSTWGSPSRPICHWRCSARFPKRREPTERGGM